MTKDEAIKICGTLSHPSKMPCPAYSIPATLCVTGSKLREKKGTVCSKCYAMKGRYLFDNVVQAMNQRASGLKSPKWAQGMVTLIGATRSPWFRWHDSGDLQGLQHLLDIVSVADRLPEKRFWLPTREVGLVSQYLAVFGSFPSNLTVRVSSPLVNGDPIPGYALTSTVVTENPTCPASLNGNRCGECRMCWDPNVKNVSYLEG